MIDSAGLRTQFLDSYGEEPRLFSAPGRVNLIGEHTDYNDGWVLPMAIERRTHVAATLRTDTRVLVRSLNAESSVEFDLNRPGPKRRGSWLDYVEGTAQALLARGLSVSGANVLISSDVPAGAGLSASAALEISVGFALASLGSTSAPNRMEIALAGQAAEHDYVGTRCGIMDQYISALGRAEHALLIDCRSLELEAVPLQLGSACVLICDTRVKHELSSSAYNERRQQCEEGVKFLARQLPSVRALRDVSEAQLETFAPRGLPSVVFKRCRHVVSENARTVAAAALLGSRNFAELGKLMVASHASLRDDYEVSCPELDAAVASALSESGVYGSRMTGGGFGGCTVTLLEQSAVERVQGAISREFARRFGSSPNFLVTRASAGVRED